MHIEFLVEEQSAEATLTNLLPKLLSEEHSYQIHPFQGKPDLLGSLEKRLLCYRHWIPPDWRVVVLVDKDDHDCLQLKQQMESAAHDAGFGTRQSSPDHVVVVNRIAIEELEAWFLGDFDAVLAAYPRVHDRSRAKRFRKPDEIVGGTWQALERVLREQILLALPMQRICSEDCKGICPVCGESRNVVACGCQVKAPDDRWAALRDL